MTNFQRNWSTGEVEVAGSTLYHKTEYRERRDHFAYFACSEPLAGFSHTADLTSKAERRSATASSQRAMIVFWSTEGSAEYAKPWTWFTALRVDRIGKTFRTPEQ